VHDESILVYDAKIRHVWAIKGSKPRMLVTGSHKRTIVSGIITDKGEQIFRQYDSCNSVAFLDFLKVTLRKFPYLILFIDRAPWHKEKNVRKFIRKNKHRLKIRWFPPGFPESNPMEECWNQGKDEILGSKFYDSFTDFKTTVTNYYRTKRFKLDLYKYLCH
jgi:transposase